MTSARDEIWIDMIQFDVRAADRLWEGIPPAHGAPEWYDDVSGLIETANRPAEPHELVDEPIVVDAMHRSTLGSRRCRCRGGRTVGRLIAMKAAAATTASVLGVAAAAAATTGVVATVASVVVPVIEEDVFPTDDDEHESATPAPPSGAAGGAGDSGLDDQPVGRGAAPTAAPSPPLADPRTAAASASPAPNSAAVDAVDAVAEPAPPTEAAPLAPVAVDPASTEPPPAAGARPDKDQRPGDKRAAGDSCERHACWDRRHHWRHGLRDGDALAEAATEP